MKEISILITGDFAPHGRVLNLLGNQKVTGFYSDFQKHLDNTDFKITNLECPLTGHDKPLDKVGPVIKAPSNSLELLKLGGFNVVTLANNHILDFGKQGLRDTIQECNSANIDYVGAGLTENSLKKPLVLEAKGIKVGIINIAEGEFSVTSDLSFGANPFDLSYLHSTIKQLKQQVDKIIVIPHGGHEFYKYPSPENVKRYRLLIDFGADIVVAHHPHCFSGYEEFNGGLIFYSLGNFSFDWPTMNKAGWNEGFAVKIFIDEKNDISFEIIPYKQGLENPGIRCLSESEDKNFKAELKEINKIISSEELLQKEWKDNLKKRTDQYLTLIQPTNKYIKALQSRRLLPKMFFKGKRNRLMLLNLIKCDAHREALVGILERK